MSKQAKKMIIKCKTCRNEFDLREAADAAVQRKERILRCPHCRSENGTIN